MPASDRISGLGKDCAHAPPSGRLRSRALCRAFKAPSCRIRSGYDEAEAPEALRDHIRLPEGLTEVLGNLLGKAGAAASGGGACLVTGCECAGRCGPMQRIRYGRMTRRGRENALACWMSLRQQAPQARARGGDSGAEIGVTSAPQSRFGARCSRR